MEQLALIVGFVVVSALAAHSLTMSLCSPQVLLTMIAKSVVDVAGASVVLLVSGAPVCPFLRNTNPHPTLHVYVFHSFGYPVLRGRAVYSLQ